MAGSSNAAAGGGVPPGFRFHPTDEELLHYYLKKKVSFQKFDMEVVREVDLNKIEPWELQERCKIGSTPQNEWYFFSHKDRKYPTGSRTNRATNAGFWKATGRDKCIRNSFKKIGMRKTLVFYRGRAPHGQKTDWIMHEYRLEDTEVDHEPQANDPAGEDGWVVCRVFKKKNLFKLNNGNEGAGGAGGSTGAGVASVEHLLNNNSASHAANSTNVNININQSRHGFMMQQRENHQYLLHQQHHHQPHGLAAAAGSYSHHFMIPLPSSNMTHHHHHPPQDQYSSQQQIQAQNFIPTHKSPGQMGYHDLSALSSAAAASEAMVVPMMQVKQLIMANAAAAADCDSGGGGSDDQDINICSLRTNYNCEPAGLDVAGANSTACEPSPQKHPASMITAASTRDDHQNMNEWGSMINDHHHQIGNNTTAHDDSICSKGSLRFEVDQVEPNNNNDIPAPNNSMNLHINQLSLQQRGHEMDFWGYTAAGK